MTCDSEYSIVLCVYSIEYWDPLALATLGTGVYTACTCACTVYLPELSDCSMLGFCAFMYVPDRVSCC